MLREAERSGEVYEKPTRKPSVIPFSSRRANPLSGWYCNSDSHACGTSGVWIGVSAGHARGAGL